MLWTWIEHDDLMFNNKRWNLNNVHKVIWDAFLDYGKVAWNTCVKLIKHMST